MGRNHFERFLSINFELEPELCKCFDDLHPEKIIHLIELIRNEKIIPGKTLLFFDEIQECPRAIMALRYFKEKMPDLHVIGAGSLLEFTLNDADFRMPVGRVQFLFLKPLTFYEYLLSIGEEKLLRHIKEYAALGGMPGVIKEYLETRSFYDVQNLQSNILATYRSDFGKYAKSIEYKPLQKLFEKAPGFISQWFKYAKVDSDMPSRLVKNALIQLGCAGLIYKVHATAADGLPLITYMNQRKFKLLFLDIGLVKRALKLDLELLFEKDLIYLNQGALAEQLVGQELLSLRGPFEESHLFFWVREKKNTSAEVDFLIPYKEFIIPIKVKAGNSGRLRSLQMFMQEKKSPIGIQISSQNFELEKKILKIPFYLIGELHRLLKEVL